MKKRAVGLDDPDKHVGEPYSSASPFCRREVLFWWSGLFLVSVLLVVLSVPYPIEGNYSVMSRAIRTWDFSAVPSDQPREFWGISYLSALIAAATRLSDPVALIAIAFCSSLVAILFCYRLWGGTVAVWFSVVNWWWLECSVGGGSEPLFVALILGSFLAVRKEHWIRAAVLASAATVVRPVGIFALAAIAIVLAARRDMHRLAAAIGIGIGIGILYVTPVVMIYGSPTVAIQSYQAQDWGGGAPVAFPLYPVIRGAIMTWGTMRLSLKILILIWVLIMLAGIFRMAASRSFRRYAREYPMEALFAGMYALFLFSYNGGIWEWTHFPRFALPLLPFVLLAFQNRLPSDRRLILGAALASTVCVVLPRIGVSHATHAIRALISG
jgi:hypothetical protein